MSAGDPMGIREPLSYVYFENGYAYCTNAYVLVKASLKVISSFDDEEIERLNGYCIRGELFKKLVTLKHDMFVVDAGKIEVNMTGYKAVFELTNVAEENIKHPDFEKLLNGNFKVSVERIGFMPRKLVMLTEAMGFDYEYAVLEFSQQNGPVRVIKKESDKVIDVTGIICPCLITD